MAWRDPSAASLSVILERLRDNAAALPVPSVQALVPTRPPPPPVPTTALVQMFLDARAFTTEHAAAIAFLIGIVTGRFTYQWADLMREYAVEWRDMLVSGIDGILTADDDGAGDVDAAASTASEGDAASAPTASEGDAASAPAESASTS